MRLTLTEEVKQKYPSLKVGIIEVRLGAKPVFDERIRAIKASVEAELGSGTPFAARIDSYNTFFKRFGSKVPMEFQLKSVQAGKGIPEINPAITCMFMAELKNMVLTAGHNLDKLGPEIIVKLASGGEGYTKINGKPDTLKAGDIFADDGAGIISSVLYGPDSRTKITVDTKSLLFMCYTFGLTDAEIRKHMEDIANYLRALGEAETELGQVQIG